jgi:hypothetical protein
MNHFTKGGDKVALFVPGSKYEDVLKENKKLKNNLNATTQETEQLRAENDKLLSLKEKYSIRAQTLQHENDDLKATLSIVRQEVLQLQSELSILTEKTNLSETKENTGEEVCCDIATEEEINPIDALESIRKYLIENLPELNVDLLKNTFNEILKKKTSMQIADEKRKKYMSQLIGILKYMVDYAKKESRLIELLTLIDDETLSKEIKEKINGIKLKDITIQSIAATGNSSDITEKDVYTQLVQVLKNLHDSVLNDRLI